MFQLIDFINDAIKTDEALTDYSLCGIRKYAHVDLYYGQPQFPDEFQFVCPALFIDYQIDYRNQVVTIDLHPIEQKLGATAPTQLNRNGAASYLYRNALLRKHLAKTVCDGFGRFKAISERPIVTGECRYHVLTMQAAIATLSAFDLPLPTAFTDGVIDEISIEANLQGFQKP